MAWSPRGPTQPLSELLFQPLGRSSGFRPMQNLYFPGALQQERPPHVARMLFLRSKQQIKAMVALACGRVIEGVLYWLLCDLQAVCPL